MNLLALVFGLLLIFACTFSLSLRKDSLAKPVEKTYRANLIASRDILNAYESQIYKGLRHKKKIIEEPTKEKEKTESQDSKINHLNRDCARLNLWTLLEENSESDPPLYEIAAALLRALYAEPLFVGQKRLEYALLNALLDSAKSEMVKNPDVSSLILEKLIIKNGNVKLLYPLQSVYYRMLKGTKKVLTAQDYPSLLDYISFEKKKTKICLKHASIEMLGILFGARAAPLLYVELHKNEPMTQERIEEICRDAGHIGDHKDLLTLIEIHPSHSSSGQKTFIAEEAGVCLKKRAFLPI